MLGVVWAKMFVYQLNKPSSYFCLDRQTKRQIIIDGFTFSILAGAFLCSVKFKFVVVVDFVYCSLKSTFC